MIDKHSGLEIRRTDNGMRDEDGLEPPQQITRVLTEDEVVELLATAPQRERE